MIEELSNLDRGRVAVQPEAMRFSPGCFVCAEPEAAPVQVRFTRTLILLVIGGIESVEITAPLCAAHATHYSTRMRRIDRLQIACGLLILLFFASLGLFAEFLPTASETVQPVLLGGVVAAVVVAYLSIGFRSTAISVRFSPRQHGRIGAYGAYVFTFPDREAAERFAAANS